MSDLYSKLESEGFLEYGAVIPEETMHSLIGVSIPAVASKKVFDALQLQILDAVATVRNALLDEGKYLAQDRGAYRIYLPSENAKQVKSYLKHGDAKYKRAQRLHKSTPTQPGDAPSNTIVRIISKRDAIKEALAHHGRMQ